MYKSKLTWKLAPFNRLGFLFLLFLLSLVLINPQKAAAQGSLPPPGFVETAIATNIGTPVGMEISPDGRIFVLRGVPRRIDIYDDNGFRNRFLNMPYVRVLGSGLLGIEFAPDFLTTGDVYIAYLTDPAHISGPQRFRLSKFSSDGSVADQNSEEVLFEVVDINVDQVLHQGGDPSIGPDGKIYWPLGDRQLQFITTQQFDSMYGKVLRLNLDGSIPTDNPYYNSLTGDFRAIYARGLRNPWRLERRETTGELFMSEVGPTDWEEINRVEEGANYGFPIYSGVSNDPLFTDPVYAYNHDPDGCAITGGGFYNSENMNFPSQYHDKFFYGDHCFGWMAYVDVDTGQSTRFATNANRLIELKVHPLNGALYYADREYAGDTTGGKGGIGRIDYIGGGSPLTITDEPVDRTIAIGQSTTFSVLVSGDGPFSFQWYRDWVEIAGATDAAYSLEDASSADDASQFHVVVTDVNGNTLQSDVAILTVSSNNAPVPTISLPSQTERYIAGEEYTFAGAAMDSEDGLLPASSLSWKIVFHHDDHTHPFIQSLTGVDGGSFTPPVNDETDPDVWYRIHLTAIDSEGIEGTVYRDLLPQQVDLTLTTNVPGLQLRLDSADYSTPVTILAVAGVMRVLDAPPTQTVGGVEYVFESWSNDGEATHSIATPIDDTTFTAIYVPNNPVVDEIPSINITSQVNGESVTSPLTISGIATDDIGVKRVQVVIKVTGEPLYWDGAAFVNSWRSVNAALDTPEGTSTAWSIIVDQLQGTEIDIAAWSRDTTGQPSSKARRKLTISNEPPPPTPAQVILENPKKGTTHTSPVTFSGSVTKSNLNNVKVVVRKSGTKEYWNGSAWQNAWYQVNATVIDDTWSYSLDIPEATGILLRARATYSDGTLKRSARYFYSIQ